MIQTIHPFPATSHDAYARSYPDYGPSFFHTLVCNPELDRNGQGDLREVRLFSTGSDPYRLFLSQKVAIDLEAPNFFLTPKQRSARAQFVERREQDQILASRFPVLTDVRNGQVPVFENPDRNNPFLTSRLTLLTYSTFLSGIDPSNKETCVALYPTEKGGSLLQDLPAPLPARPASLLGVPSIQHIPVRRESASFATVYALYVPSPNPRVTEKRRAKAVNDMALTAPLIRSTLDRHFSPFMTYRVLSKPLQLNYASAYGLGSTDLSLSEITPRGERVLDYFPPIFEENHSANLHFLKQHTILSSILLSWTLPSSPEDFILIDSAQPHRVGSFYRSSTLQNRASLLTSSTATFVNHLLAYDRRPKIQIFYPELDKGDSPPVVPHQSRPFKNPLSSAHVS